MTAHVAPWKKDAVASLVSKLGETKVVGIIDVRGVPAPAFQTMRSNLRDKAQITMLKNSLARLALQEAGKKRSGMEGLVGAVDGQCALVTSDLNPFRLFKQLDATKTKMPARGGEISPEDIEIKAGDTPFKPGPIVGDLQKAGLPAAIEQGKVVIKRDKLLVKEGDEISREVALVLSKLEIFPITVGLDLRAAFEDGVVFEKDVLVVDDAEYFGKVRSAAAEALNLAVFIGHPNEVSTKPLLTKAHFSALNLAANAGVMNSETVRLALAKARASMIALASKAPEALDDDLKAALSRAPAAPAKGEGGAATGAAKEDRKDDKGKKDDEKASEEEAAAGLSALFG
ncbi:MAG: 50S ribosomal protein L10 [Methanobacteriota archaeon]|nr:MAG: 50S ribosomal protein L10 [Euryarchaeota archaeon]